MVPVKQIFWVCFPLSTCPISGHLVEMDLSKGEVLIQHVLKCLLYILGVKVQAEHTTISKTTCKLDFLHLVNSAEASVSPFLAWAQSGHGRHGWHGRQRRAVKRRQTHVGVLCNQGKTVSSL